MVSKLVVVLKFKPPKLDCIWKLNVLYYEKNYYCTISINSAGPVTRDGPAEILVSASSQSRRDMPEFSAM
jgi:hypothetical protein